MSAEAWVCAGSFWVAVLTGCGTELGGCTSNGELLKEQILHQRDTDAAGGAFVNPKANPCDLSPADMDRLRATNPSRVSEYAEACRRLAAQGCSISPAEAQR